MPELTVIDFPQVPRDEFGLGGERVVTARLNRRRASPRVLRRNGRTDRPMIDEDVVEQIEPDVLADREQVIL